MDKLICTTIRGEQIVLAKKGGRLGILPQKTVPSASESLSLGQSLGVLMLTSPKTQTCYRQERGAPDIDSSLNLASPNASDTLWLSSLCNRFFGGTLQDCGKRDLISMWVNMAAHEPL